LSQELEALSAQYSEDAIAFATAQDQKIKALEEEQR
jgi:hypothetical protein